MARKLKGTAIQAGTISVTQLDNSVSTVIQTGGGPKITAVQVTDASWVVLDDTAVDTAGGNILITGTGFVSGCLVYIGQTPANSVGFVSSTQVRVNVPALTAGTYPVYLSNPDGGTAIRLPGVTTSANPAWQTASALPEQYDGVAINLNLVATEATSYTLTSGTLPPGLSLNSNTGVITGTVPSVTVDTTYTFTVRATDAQLQDSPRTFTVTITVSDAYFKLTSLLLSGSAISANTVVRDSSTNNFNLTVYGDARASNFTPYGTGWSILTRDRSYITIPASSDFDIINTDFTIEFWFNPNAFNTMSYSGSNFFGTGLATAVNGWSMGWSGSGTTVTAMEFRVFASQAQSANSFTGLTVNFGTWYHIALQRNGASAGNLRLFVNGVLQGSAQTANTYSIAGGDFVLGSGSYLQNGTYSGNADYYISNIRLTKSAVYDITGFTPPTSNLTQLTNTTLLIGQSNRLINNGTNTGAITSSGHTSTRVQLNSFNPFNITNTGVNGSMYFDGTGDYVTAPSNAVFGPSGDFTFESWLYWTGGSNENTLFCVDVSGGINIGLAFGTGGANWGIGRRALVVDNEFGTAPTKFTWNHLAVSRQSGTIRAFVNGRLVFSGANTVSYVAGPPGIACIATASTNILQGYISDARFVSAAVYTANFTPATSSLTAITNTQLLTLQYDQPHNNHTFLDSSSNQFLITRNGNATQGTFSPFSQAGWSVYINNGTSSQIRISDNATLRIGTSAFNIEAWVYPTGFGEPFYILRKRVNGNVGAGTWAFTVATNGSVLLEQVQGPATIAQTSAGLVALNTWTHVAVSRDSSNNVKIFVNGTIQATATSSYNFNDASNPISLLCDYDGRNASSIGYASNLRFVIGSAVYTANFTPATSNLTSSSQGAVAADVKILTFQDNRFRDASTNNFTITISGSPSIQAFSPFAPTAVYSPAVHGGSAYFDGTGDALTIADNVSFELGGGSFTIEAWIYPLNISSGSIVSKNYGGGGPYSYDLSMSNGELTSGFFPNYGATGWQSITTSGAGITTNSWYHIALVRTVNQVNIYVNGVSRVSTTTAITLYDNDLVLQIGGVPTSNQAYFTGYISNVRITKGAAVYTTNFTPPTAPVTAATNTSLLLNFTDAAIIDSTGRNAIETVADSKSSSVITKFTGGSMWFDGTGDRLATVFSPLQDLSLGNWTIEFWLNLGATIPTTYRSICGASNGGGGLPKWVMLMNANTGYTYQANRLMFATYNGADRQINVAVTWASNTWYHIAVVHNNGTTALYLDGSSQGTIAFNIASGITGAIRIGADGEGYSDFTGYISDLRITRGYARYTANFTAPTAPARLK